MTQALKQSNLDIIIKIYRKYIVNTTKSGRSLKPWRRPKSPWLFHWKGLHLQTAVPSPGGLEDVVAASPVAWTGPKILWEKEKLTRKQLKTVEEIH